MSQYQLKLGNELIPVFTAEEVSKDIKTIIAIKTALDTLEFSLNENLKAKNKTRSQRIKNELTNEINEKCESKMVLSEQYHQIINKYDEE